MKAVEDKKISLDKKLSDFYPEIPNADKITIEHLLQHRTGIHNLTDEAEFLQYYTQPHTGNDLVNIIKNIKVTLSRVQNMNTAIQTLFYWD